LRSAHANAMGLWAAKQQSLRHPRKDTAASALKPGKAKALAGPANVF